MANLEQEIIDELGLDGNSVNNSSVSKVLLKALVEARTPKKDSPADASTPSASQPKTTFRVIAKG